MRGRAFGVGLAVLTGAGAAPAAEPPLVKVEFKLNDDSYRQHFDRSPAVIGALEAAVAERLSRTLSDHHRFLRFASAPAGPGEYGLRVALEPLSAAENPPLREVGLQVSASGPDGGVQQARAYWRLRTAQQGLVRIGSPDELGKEIEVKTEAAGFHDLLAHDVLRRIPIAEKGFLWTDPLGWILPYRDRELCMGQGSRLVVRNNLPTGAGVEPVEVEAVARMPFDPPTPAPSPYEEQRLNLFARAEKPDALGTVADPKRVAVVAVFVAQFVDLGGACGEPLSPEAAFPQP